jgi:hypothetical protein
MKAEEAKSEGRSQKAEVSSFILHSSSLVLLASSFILHPSSFVAAAPRQEDVFRGIQDGLHDQTDPTTVLAVVCAVVGIVILLIVINRWRQREVSPKAVNHQGKLTKELQKQMSLKPAEVRQLKALAEGTPVENPLALLLCPSLLVKAAKENPEKLDRKVVGGMLKRMGG